MELLQTIILNEDAIKSLPEQRRELFIFEWLKYINEELLVVPKSEIKEFQRKLVKQLTEQINLAPGPPTRKLLANCFATLFSVGDTFIMFDTVNACNDILKNKDDSPSFLSTKLAAINILGSMYEKLGRLMGRSYEETVQILLKTFKNAESQTRIEIIMTLEKVCAGMGSAISNVHKDIYKAIKYCLNDRNIPVRVAAARCLLEMVNHAPFLYTTELENVATLCFRAFDGSNYEVRCAVAKFLGTLLSFTQKFEMIKKPINSKQQSKIILLEEALGILMSGFLRGGFSFLKGTGEMIKGSSGVNREVRVGVTHSYVIFVQTMGSVWFEKHMNIVFSHVLELVANPKVASSHVDAVYSRKCINFILKSVNSKMLGEKAQTSACKELVQIISKQMKSIDFNPENSKDSNQETLFGQHLLVCALQEIGCLTMVLGTTMQNLITDNTLNFINTIYSVLVHPSPAARLAAAWCLRSICVACPNQITPLIDRLVETIDKNKMSSEAISGYSSALAAVLASVKCSPLGVPHTKGKIVFNTAEELLRSASQNSRMSLPRTQAGWLLIGSIMTLGSSVVKGLLPRILLLWRNCFPKSNKDLESEKTRGDSFTWQVTLEGRAGALSVMCSFLQNCNDLVNDDITKKMFLSIDSALAMLINLSSALKSFGQQLKASIAMVRLRLYETLSLLPPSALESSYTHLLRMLVSEFTLAENPANTTNSILHGLCHGDNSIIMKTWFEETEHKNIEEQLQSNSAAGSGAIEHDSCCLYRNIILQNCECPGPLPLGIAVIDQSIILFGVIFPRAANKHRVQMLEHFSECIKQAKSVRQEAVQMNIFAALLRGFKGLTDSKSNIEQEDVKKSATRLIISALCSTNAIIRYAASEAVGRMVQVVGESKFTAEMSQNIFHKLRSARDVITRTGHSLALGCLHRYVGGMGSSQHLNKSVSILLALSQDASSPVVQVWALYALSLIADSGGPMFRGYAETTLLLCVKLLLQVSQSNIDVHQCIGRLLNALITTMGPELQGESASLVTMRNSFLAASSIMQNHSDPLVQAEATGCLQQLHLFAPKYVILHSLVPTLIKTLSSHYLILRKAAVSCLRQLSQREAKEVCDIAFLVDNITNDFGLPGILFAMLDLETDIEIIKNIHDTLTSMLQLLVSDNLITWLNLCKSILTVNIESNNNESQKSEEDEVDNEDDIEYHAEEDLTTHPAVQPRWPTRVFAAVCVRKIISTCEAAKSIHFDLVQAKEMQMIKHRGHYLILHLSDLIRMSFMAATSESDQLRLEGLRTLQEIIDRFSGVPEPEFPGHLLLEQFQAQVGAALRPAFASETACHVTAAACEVCSAWIVSGVARDINDLRRVHQLLVSSLTKLRENTNTTQLYNESMATLEKLSILKAWAEVYIVSMIRSSSAPANNLKKQITAQTKNNLSEIKDSVMFVDIENRGESLLTLVEPELPNLSKHWLDALKDHALLRLPREFQNQLPHDGGAFFTTDTINSSKQHYFSSWPSILYAASLWLNNGLVDNTFSNKIVSNNCSTSVPTNSFKNRFYMLFGICIEALCSARTSEKSEHVISSLQSLYTIFSSDWSKRLLAENNCLVIELCNVLHRQILIRDDVYVQLICVEILRQLISGSSKQLETNSTKETAIISDTNVIEEGVSSGEVIPGKSIVYSVLEVCLCIFVRYIPNINLPISSSNETYRNALVLNYANGMLIASGLQCSEALIPICSTKGTVSILSTILYMTTMIIKELAKKSVTDSRLISDTAPVKSALQCLKVLCSNKKAMDKNTKVEWEQLLQSSLASIIDVTKTVYDLKDETKMDEVTMLLTISVFILNSGSNVVTIPSLQYPCINLFRQCLQSENRIVKLKCIQIIKSIFLYTELKVSTPYIHALAPKIIERLHHLETKCPRDEIDVSYVMESIAVTDILINLVEPKNRIRMLALNVPVLIAFLCDPSKLLSLTKYERQLHDQSLQWLLKIGPKYPHEFKTLISQTSLKQRLEICIRHNQQKTKNDFNLCITESFQDNSKSKNVNQKPTITLKKNFSNFN
ncbi:HEATR5B family protein [Megaselia abdita]